MNLNLDAEPETTFIGDLIVTSCLSAVAFAGFYLGWQVFLALREVLS